MVAKRVDFGRQLAPTGSPATRQCVVARGVVVCVTRQKRFRYLSEAVFAQGAAAYWVVEGITYRNMTTVGTGATDWRWLRGV